MTKTSPAAQGTVAIDGAARNEALKSYQLALDKNYSPRAAMDGAIREYLRRAPSPEALPAGMEAELSRMRFELSNRVSAEHEVLMAEALAEIKATVDGESDQPVRDIIYGLLAEIEKLPKRALASDASPVPTPQQISDYLRGCDAIRRQVLEREALAASDASPRGEAVAWAQTGYESQLARYGAFPMRSEKDETLGYVEPLYAHPAPAPHPPGRLLRQVQQRRRHDAR